MEGYLLFDLQNEPNQYGCEKFNRNAELNPIVGDSPFIIVKKGLCSPTLKVKNIEEAGGHAAIIINDKDEPIEKMFLADDGNGGEISIPAVLISLSDGNKLINFYTQNKPDKNSRIRLEIYFALEKSDNTVKYDLWFTPDQTKVYEFLNNFEKYQKLLGDSAILGMHYITYPFFSYDENSKSPIDDCLGSGLYCIRPSSEINDGALIALESIKQKCIYKFSYENQSKDNPYSKDIFWNYMNTLYTKCISQKNYNQICSDNAISSVGLQLEQIGQCVKNSFIGSIQEKQNKNFEKILKNQILDEEYTTRKRNFITRVPSLTINGRLYDGSWRADYVFDALCASMIKKPDACFKEGIQREIGFSGPAVFFIIVIVLAINIILFILCKNLIKKKIMDRIESIDINSRIDDAVNTYFALKDQPSE